MTAYQNVQQFTKMLKNLDSWIETAVAHATKKGFDPEVFAASRLAPDQYPLVKQVQSACDSAKFAAAYLSGQKAPAHPDTETTIAQLRERIASCLRFIERVPADDYTGADDRKVSPPWLQGKWMKGSDYLTQTATPNFYFHVTTAYAILRHNGVDLGKMAYIGSLPLQDA
ncbi:MAG: DUF1993 domain-containing protein [Nannocystis sp.]|nr:DUF1993 domain-containing protein [Nannocystis sp.]MBA3547792.1 DUF1993 domain-containing protein [Nannocystis sp.]